MPGNEAIAQGVWEAGVAQRIPEQLLGLNRRAFAAGQGLVGSRA